MYGYPYQYPIPAQSRNELVRVTGSEGAKAYQMPPNSCSALFDSNDDVFYLKSTDGAGFGTIRTFRFEQVTQNPISTQYVTRKQFDELKEMISSGKQSVRESKRNSE